jgi:hypothetical protein
VVVAQQLVGLERAEHVGGGEHPVGLGLVRTASSSGAKHLRSWRRRNARASRSSAAMSGCNGSRMRATTADRAGIASYMSSPRPTRTRMRSASGEVGVDVDQEQVVHRRCWR